MLDHPALENSYVLSLVLIQQVRVQLTASFNFA